MLKVGITGGIGSGKTHIAKIFQDNYIPVFYADVVIKELILKNENLFDNIEDIDFNNFNYLKKIKNIIMPYLMKEYVMWCEKYKNKHFTCIVSSYLIEYGISDKLDYMINVVSDINIRVNRIKYKDPRMTIDSIKTIINSQMSDNERNEKCNFIIINNENENTILKDVLRIKNNMFDDNSSILQGIARINIKFDCVRKIIRKIIYWKTINSDSKINRQ